MRSPDPSPRAAGGRDGHTLGPPHLAPWQGVSQSNAREPCAATLPCTPVSSSSIGSIRMCSPLLLLLLEQLRSTSRLRLSVDPARDEEAGTHHSRRTSCLGSRLLLATCFSPQCASRSANGRSACRGAGQSAWVEGARPWGHRAAGEVWLLGGRARRFSRPGSQVR